MRQSTILLSIALAGTVGVSSWLFGSLQVERSASSALRTRIEALERPPVKAPVAVRVASSATPSPTRAFNAVVEPPQATPGSSPSPRYPGWFQQRLLKNPEFRKALRTQQRQVIEDAFRDLPRFLNLTPEQATRVFDLLADQSVRKLELQWSWPASQETGRSIQALSDDLRAQSDADMTKLLGESDMRQLKDFRASLGSRNEVDALRSELARAPEPLREDQLEPMIAVVYAEQQRMDQELRDRKRSLNADDLDPAVASARVELAIAANERIVESASSLLTGAQLSAVEAFYRRQRLQMESQNVLSRLQAEAMAVKAN